jgi:hypothetical protein
MPEPIILLRLFVEVGGEAEAEAEKREVVSRLEREGTVTVHRFERYWKIAENWEISLYLHPAGPALDVYERLVAMAEAGWTIGELTDGEVEQERWSVWNAAPGVEFLTPRLVWAHVELLPWGLNQKPIDPDEFEDLDA